jgi:curved DNA-binding protein
MGVELVDYYRLLAVAHDADADAIRSAWRRLARRYHPDVAKGKKAAGRFIQIREAYEVLSDPERRRRYDAWRQRVAPASPRRGRTPASPTSRPAAPTSRAGARPRGIRLDALGIHIGITFGRS